MVNDHNKSLQELDAMAFVHKKGSLMILMEISDRWINRKRRDNNKLAYFILTSLFFQPGKKS